MEKDWAEFWKMKYLEASVELRNANRGIERRSRRKRRAEEYDLLRVYTGNTAKDWVGWLELTIAKHSFPADDAPQRTHTYAVYAELLDAVRGGIKRTVGSKNSDGELFDMNITVAQVMAEILATWSIAVIEAKSFDSNRPIAARREMLKIGSMWRRRFANALLMQKQIREPWKEQRWENPFSVKESCDAKKIEETKTDQI